ncbi:MAG: hypothetical protein VKJ02_17270 [Snowella sp.]|nr:hypothetical protein [Snowella sp.]
MIRIQKNKTAPNKLQTDGKQQRKSHCLSYSRNPVSYQTGEKTFTFKSNIYGHPEVKQALIDAQGEKCCFCERKIGEDGDVEHFRPKQAYKQESGQPLQRPGYYWLAYEWDNLYLACTACNQRHKQNLFPLSNPKERATNHKMDLNQENPIFIDPGKEDPEKFIQFRVEVPVGIDQDGRGEFSIKALGLNRPTLSKTRFEKIEQVYLLDRVIKLADSNPQNSEWQELAKEAKQSIEKSISKLGEFSSAVKCVIKDDFQIYKQSIPKS